MQLIPKEEILEELSRLKEEIAVTMKWIHIGTIEVVIKATFKEGIDSEIHLSIMDRRINNLRDGCLGTMIGNLYAGKLMFDIHPRIAYNLADQDFSRVLTLHQDFKRKDLMKEGNRRYSITYRIAYALSNTHLSDLFVRKEYIEIPRIFKEFAKQPVVGRYEGMLEIAGHEFLVAGIAGRENGCMTLGLSFLEDHKPWGREEYFAAYIDSGSGIYTAKPGVFPKEARETLPVIAGRDFSQKILILNTGIREAKIMIGGAFGMPWFRVLRREKAFNRIMPINFRSKRGDVDAKLTHQKMQDKRKFGKVLLSFRQQGLIDSDSFYEESEEEIKNLKEAITKLLGSGEFCRYFHKGPRKIQKGFSATFERNGKHKLEMGGNHTQRVRELKQVCNNLPKLAIPQDEDELVVYTEANDYRWATVLMKKTTTGEEPCRYTGGLFTEQQAQVWHINEKEFFAVWKAFKKWPLFLLAKEFTLKVDNTNVKAFLKITRIKN
ncbi:UNVERIFIED_CONTAM: movement protein [Sesamum calycinum]|uniref:Movement protein n=1 Tax=Sesamum calycinum TaxID=2727403 RepID=A0AAW2LKH3_9LAMI